MTRDISEEAPVTAGWGQRLRNISGAVGRRWPRRLRLGVPRLRPWQWAVMGAVALLLVVWTIPTAGASSMYTATVLITDGEHGIAPPDALFDFGDLPPGAGIEHNTFLKNTGVVKSRVSIVIIGEIRGMVDIEDAFFTLDPGEERQIIVELSVPASAEIGKRYSGKAFIIQTPWPFP